MHKAKMATAAALLACTAAASFPATAADFSVDCPASNALAAVTMSYADGKLTVIGPTMNGILPARATYVEGSSTEIASVFGAGPLMAIMPDRAALDQCWGDQIKQKDAADDEDVQAFLLLSCQNSVAQTAAPIEVQAAISVSLTEQGQSEMGAQIQRTYKEPSTVTGKPLKLDEFPMRSCMKK